MSAVRNDWSGQTFPHPPGRRRLTGDAFLTDPRRPLQSVLAETTGLGPIFELKVFRQRFVFVTDALLAAELSDEHVFEKALSPALESLRDVAGQGLFTAYTEEPNWRLAHDLLLPAFTRTAMQRYHPIMLRTATELVDRWDEAEGPVDVTGDMTRLTMETISRAAFSRDFGSFSDSEPHPFVTAMVTALRSGQRKGSLRTMPFSWVLVRRIERRNAPQRAYVDGLLDDLIASRRAEGDPGQDDLLGIMLNARHPDTGERLDDLNIRHQILTFLVAGHETTSGALSFALYHLSRDRDALARAQAETDAVLGPDRDAEPSFEQVAKFRHIRRVLDESLRLWPTAPGFARTPRVEPTVLSTGHTMRPGDWAIVLLPRVHRDPGVWGPDADEFDPDRFLPERVRERPAHTYLPFGTGERACIGRQFALHEAVLVLARLLHRYDIAGDPGYELAVTERLTLVPQDFRLWLSPRGSSSGRRLGPDVGLGDLAR